MTERLVARDIPRWGYINAMGVFIPLPKQPMIDAGLTEPPFDVQTPSGEIRHVVVDPDWKGRHQC